ncbi:Uncharacterised protein [Bordetella pertussis]|nr:Uncharacterised protein [Bordetella pertussis]CFP63788.1 Uncharacterised protein [Bordetella pertussis]CFW36127.1 Uncharacterised protein [Bordetella pertussis]
MNSIYVENNKEQPGWPSINMANIKRISRPEGEFDNFLILGITISLFDL